MNELMFGTIDESVKVVAGALGLGVNMECDPDQGWYRWTFSDGSVIIYTTLLEDETIEEMKERHRKEVEELMKSCCVDEKQKEELD